MQAVKEVKEVDRHAAQRSSVVAAAHTMQGLCELAASSTAQGTPALPPFHSPPETPAESAKGERGWRGEGEEPAHALCMHASACTHAHVHAGNHSIIQRTFAPFNASQRMHRSGRMDAVHATRPGRPRAAGCMPARAERGVCQLARCPVPHRDHDGDEEVALLSLLSARGPGVARS